jgi:hypothetical protein
MQRTRRAVAVFLLSLTLALPVAALPGGERAQESGPDLFAAIWARLAPIFGVWEKSGSMADPNGLTSTSPETSQLEEGDSQSSADPNG